ncbi:hypothetical protein WJX74_001745 [Apatococcus lobatus]|uniref:U-box domain-containing protein n=1 Tax=Apatococcus lobatus TaxID=904363 RepID=A0AAW1QH50_9CHLO
MASGYPVVCALCNSIFSHRTRPLFFGMAYEDAVSGTDACSLSYLLPPGSWCLQSTGFWGDCIHKELAIFGVADVIAAIVVPLWLESGTVGKYSASWLVADVLISLFLNSGPDAALHLFLRIKSLVMLVRALADQEVPKLQIPPELEAALEDAHDLKCPITLELLVDPCILNGKIYERVAIAKWIFLHHTVPHSPARRAFVRDLKPCPKMKRLIKQL